MIRKCSKKKLVIESLRLPKIVIRTVYGDMREFTDINDKDLLACIELLVFREITFTVYVEYMVYRNGRINYDGRKYYDFTEKETVSTR